MAENNQEKITAFDTLFTTNHIQILKIILSYMEPSQQQSIAVYIKLMELQYTMSFFKLHSASAFPSEKSFDAGKLCDEILPFCNYAEQEQMKQTKGMVQNLTNMQEMMQMMEMMKDMFPEGENPFGGDLSNLFSGLSGMSGMDMSQIFEMFQTK